MKRATVTKDSAAVWVPIDELVLWSKNPRLNDFVVDQVAESIKTLGWGEVILARTEDKMVIAGHTRLKAARKLGLDFVPVRFVDVDLKTAERLAIASNKLGELAAWDDGVLAAILAQMDEADRDVLGFHDKELEDLLALTRTDWVTEGAADIDAIGAYDPTAETFLIKIESIRFDDKDRVLSLVNEALRAGGVKYEAKAY